MIIDVQCLNVVHLTCDFENHLKAFIIRQNSFFTEVLLVTKALVIKPRIIIVLVYLLLDKTDLAINDSKVLQQVNEDEGFVAPLDCLAREQISFLQVEMDPCSYWQFNEDSSMAEITRR